MRVFKRRRGRHAAPDEHDQAGAAPDSAAAPGSGPPHADATHPSTADSDGVATTAARVVPDASRPDPAPGSGHPGQERAATLADTGPGSDDVPSPASSGGTIGIDAHSRRSADENTAHTAPPPVAPLRTLPTDAPEVGDHLQPLPLPRLAPPTTSLPGLRADGGLLGDRWLGAASLVGQSHMNSGTTAQDAYQFALSDDGSLLVAAVCDGLGSRPLTSQLGATVLAAALCETARSVTADGLADDPPGVLGGVLEAACARTSQLRAAGMAGLTDRDLSCTAALVLLPVEGTGWAARVGDCAVLRLAGEEWATVFERDGGPVNRVSAALPHPRPAEVAEYASLAEESPAGCLILASDGLAEDAFGSPAVRAWLADRWSRPCDAAAMADSLRYRRRGSHDDRTALVVWPRQLRDG
ncbi:protein phosphatase 2C domain-containing protein [Streptomyces sp. NPDC048278]|uniref:protein phosphatase 2C domain-containing protein n=1 Tax=Streptomyces sp. NPDC048278 TaxID=3155809 RepID=UPI003424AF15